MSPVNWFKRWSTSLVVFCSIGLVYGATATYGGVQSRDTLTAAVAAWALGARHTFNLSFLHIAHQSPSMLWIVHGAHSSLVSNRFPGAVILATPAYALMGGWYSPVPATIVAAAATAGSCTLVYGIFLKLYSKQIALVGVCLLAFATSNWTVSGRELWEHSGAGLVIAAGMLFLLARKWTVAGLFLGSAILFRPHLGVAVAVIAIGIVWIERRWAPGIRFGFAASGGLAALLAWNWEVYGRLTITGGYADPGAGGVGPAHFLVNVAGTFVSLERGVLVCSPILILAIVGLREAWRNAPRYVRLTAIAGVGYLMTQLWLIRFNGGDGFIGYRTSLEAIMFGSPLLLSAGVAGMRKLGSGVAWCLVAVSISFFSVGAFAPGEIKGGGFNPWTTWAPLQLVHLYGAERVVVGLLVGMGSVLVAWLCYMRHCQAHSTDARPASTAERDAIAMAVTSPLFQPST